MHASEQPTQQYMLHALDEPNFFSESERQALTHLSLADSGDNKAIFGALMLAPLFELCLADGATTTAEFAVIEDCVKSLERDFELASKEELESVGTTMGLLPFVPSLWKDADFLQARKILAASIERLDEPDQHTVRNWISKRSLQVAEASGGVFHLLSIPRNERPILHSVIEDLQLAKSAEGLHLIGKTEA